MYLLSISAKSIFLLIYHVVWLAQPCSADANLDPSWIDPHAWSTEAPELMKLNPRCTPCQACDQSAKAEYFRLVQSLFNPDEFRYDEATGYLYRTVHIHVTKEQLELLSDSRDSRYIDGLISDVLAQTSFGTMQLVKEYSVDLAVELWKHVPDLSNVDFRNVVRSRSVFINVLLLVALYFTCRRYNISYMVTLAFAGVYCLYEFLDYECHKRIELDLEVEFIYGKEQNPCSRHSNDNWVHWLVGKDARSRCREFLARSSSDNNQCGVVNLFHEFIMNIILKQMKIFFTSIADMIQTISATNGIIVTAVTIYFMKDLLTQFIKSLFQYIINPTVWSRVYADANTTVPTQPAPQSHQTLPNTSDIRSLEVDMSNNKFKLTFGGSMGVDVLTTAIQTLTLDDRLSSTSSISSIEPKRIESIETTDSSKSSLDCIPRLDFDDLSEDSNSTVPTSQNVNKERRHKKESRRNQRDNAKEHEYHSSLNSSEEQRIHDELFALNKKKHPDVIEILSESSEPPSYSESDTTTTTDSTDNRSISPSPSKWSVSSSVEIIPDLSFSE